MIKKELITKFLNKYKTKISSITFFINSIYQQNIFLYNIILQAGAPSWRNVYQVVSQLNPWIGSFSFVGRRPLRFFHWCSLFSPHIPNYLIARSCKSSIVLENGERKWPKIDNVILAKFAFFNIICVDCHFQIAGLSKESVFVNIS